MANMVRGEQSETILTRAAPKKKYADVLERKVMLAESVRDSVCGHFLWLLASHDNPAAANPTRALWRVDKVGPYNYKGLFCRWEQPTDAYYMYKAHEGAPHRASRLSASCPIAWLLQQLRSVRLHRFETFIAAAWIW